MREDAAVSHRTPGPFRALGLTPLSVTYRTYPIGLAPVATGRAYFGGPHSGLVWLALLSAQTPVNGLVTYPKRVPSGVIMGQPPVSPIWDRFDFTDARLSRVEGALREEPDPAG